MKTKTTFFSLLVMLTAFTNFAQNIEFTFSNTQITNDGTDDFYETDVMIAAVDGQTNFKLGSGLLYINYNTSAFGSNIDANANAEVTHPNPDYILGDINGFPYYTSFNLIDNTDSRIAFSFQQGISSGSMTTENVTGTPKRLFHLKIKFIDSALDPMVVFEDNEIQPPGVNDGRDQFYTACGPETAGFPDCAGELGMQFLNAIFTSNGSTLSNRSIETSFAFAIYPNPATDVINIKTNIQLKKVELYNILGKRVLNSTQTQKIRVNQLSPGVYLIKVHMVQGTITKKVVIE